LGGIYILKNILIATLLYHIMLLICIYGIARFDIIKLFIKGAKWPLGPAFCLSGLTAGGVILYLGPIARLEQVDLAKTLASLNLDRQWYLIYAVYACLVNPFLEEAFWRGCFKNNSLLPNPIDALFSGYHALVVIPVLRTPYIVLLFLAMLGVGWLFRILYRVTGGLLIPLLTHFVADIAILYAIWKIV